MPTFMRSTIPLPLLSDPFVPSYSWCLFSQPTKSGWQGNVIFQLYYLYENVPYFHLVRRVGYISVGIQASKQTLTLSRLKKIETRKCKVKEGTRGNQRSEKIEGENE